MANPTWFDADFYLKGKLDQLNAVDPKGKLNDGKAWSTVNDVRLPSKLPATKATKACTSTSSIMAWTRTSAPWKALM